MREYRFDDACGKVYKYDKDNNSYVYFCSYVSANIQVGMRKKTKIKLVKNKEFENWLLMGW